MTCDVGPTSMHVRDLGRVGYAEALSLQRERNEAVIAGHAPPTLLLLEHDPVITISRRRAAREHLLASPDRLADLGIDVQETDRGGDITYHGPGQLVAYPILPLQPYSLNLSRYMRLLEQVVIDTVARFGITAERLDGATGVWVRAEGRGQGAGVRNHTIPPAAACGLAHSPSPNPQASGHTPHAKICALGVRIRKNVTMHGLALNVTTNLDHFNTIVPCGLADHAVTSLHQLLGPATPDMPTVKNTLATTFQHHLQAAARR